MSGNVNNLPKLPDPDCTGRCKLGRSYNANAHDCIECEDYPIPPDGIYYDEFFEAVVQIIGDEIIILSNNNTVVFAFDEGVEEIHIIEEL